MSGLEMGGLALLCLSCGLDRTALLQFMIARPLIAASMAGWVLGQPLLGLQVGVSLELLWLAHLPVGASIPPDDTQIALGTITLAVLGVRIGGLPTETALFTGLLLGLILGQAGRFLDHRARQWNARMVLRVPDLVEQGEFEQLERLHLRGLLHFGLVSFLSFLVIVLPGTGLLYLGRDLIDEWLAPLSSVGVLLVPLVGVAGIWAQNRSHSRSALFGTGFVLIWALLLVWK